MSLWRLHRRKYFWDVRALFVTALRIVAGHLNNKVIYIHIHVQLFVISVIMIIKFCEQMHLKKITHHHHPLHCYTTDTWYGRHARNFEYRYILENENGLYVPCRVVGTVTCHRLPIWCLLCATVMFGPCSRPGWMPVACIYQVTVRI